ncbi:hypothetical protein JVW24_19160, partial [Vibrio cholerae O1]|nr:hypothetical protein [Vibrio cholerae O1]
DETRRAPLIAADRLPEGSHSDRVPALGQGDEEAQLCTSPEAAAEAARPFAPLVAAWVAVVSVATGGAVPAEGAVLAERASFAEET